MRLHVTKALVAAIDAAMRPGETYADVYARGGPSDTTMTKLRKVGEPIGPGTLRKLQRAFDWSEDEMRAVVSGDWPPPRETHDGHIAHAAQQLNPRLAAFTDYELVTEIETRLLVAAARLQELGEDALVFVDDRESGDRVITSRPTRRRM